MKNSKLNEEFRRWSLAEACAEAQSNYSFIRNIPSRTALRFCEYVDNLPKKSVVDFATGLWQRWNTEVPRENDRVIEKQNDLIRGWTNPEVVVLSQKELMLRQWIKNGQIKLINRLLLRKLVHSSISEFLNVDAEKWGGGMWRWEKNFDTIKLYTDIDFGGRSGKQMSYQQTIRSKNDNYIINNISFLAYLGISGETNWEYIEEANVDAVLNQLLNLVGRSLVMLERYSAAAECSR